MAAARIFMFGSRDVWFVVGLPVFLYAHGWQYMEVAGFIAAWTIGYGFVQAIAPSVIRRSARRPVARGARGAAVGRDSDGDSGRAGARAARAARVARPDLVVVGRACACSASPSR